MLPGVDTQQASEQTRNKQAETNETSDTPAQVHKNLQMNKFDALLSASAHLTITITITRTEIIKHSYLKYYTKMLTIGIENLINFHVYIFAVHCRT